MRNQDLEREVREISRSRKARVLVFTGILLQQLMWFELMGPPSPLLHNLLLYVTSQSRLPRKFKECSITYRHTSITYLEINHLQKILLIQLEKAQGINVSL